MLDARPSVLTRWSNHLRRQHRQMPPTSSMVSGRLWRDRLEQFRLLLFPFCLLLCFEAAPDAFDFVRQFQLGNTLEARTAPALAYVGSSSRTACTTPYTQACCACNALA